MKKIGFIGAYDKTDLIIYVAKILTTLQKKVLVVDATTNQKARYVIPVINPTTMYVTEYEEIDIAVGFSDFSDIKKYLGIPEEQEFEYDIVLIDTDNIGGIHNFELSNAQKNYFVTSFDAYSLKKGLEALVDLKIIWSENRIYFPIENGDLSVIYENQRVAKIKFRKLSIQYKDSLAYLAEEILGDTSDNMIRRAIKTIEKGI